MNASTTISIWRHQYLRTIRTGSTTGLLLRMGFLMLALLTVTGLAWTTVIVLPQLDAMAAIQRVAGGFMRDYLVVVTVALFAGNLWLSASSPFAAAAYRYLPISMRSVALMVQVARVMNVRYAALGGALTWLQYVIAGEGYWGQVAVAAILVLILDEVSIAVASFRSKRGASALAPGIFIAVIILLDIITVHAVSGRVYEWLFDVDTAMRDLLTGVAASGVVLVWYANGLIRNDLRFAS